MEVPTTCLERKAMSSCDVAVDFAELLERIGAPTSGTPETDTVLYLAYGSNLSAKTFKGVRGIQPLSQVNVLVPELELTFDLPGIPYIEPCFANTRYRTPLQQADGSILVGNDYHKDRWHKGLVGVVYELSKADFATVIATEGPEYQDVVVSCFEIPPGTKIIDSKPTRTPFRAHTLFAPYSPPSKPVLSPERGQGRPDPSYAQPSARYLNTITEGAEEHDLPQEYRDFLYDFRPYITTSWRQKAGQVVFQGLWMPLILDLIKLGHRLTDDEGRVPSWLATLEIWIFAGMWLSYDVVFKPIFGDGERTQYMQEYDEIEAGRVCPEKQPLTKAYSLA